MNSTAIERELPQSERNSTDDIAFRSIRHPQRPRKMTMKAIFQAKYGSPDELEVMDIDKPVAGDNEVLVRVQAAGLHVGDCFGVRGKPLLVGLPPGAQAQWDSDTQQRHRGDRNWTVDSAFQTASAVTVCSSAFASVSFRAESQRPGRAQRT
jgi:hypothetical protein